MDGHEGCQAIGGVGYGAGSVMFANVCESSGRSGDGFGGKNETGCLEVVHDVLGPACEGAGGGVC